MVSVNLDRNLLIDKDGRKHELSANDFWYIAPQGGFDSLLRGLPQKKMISEIGLTLHNAKIGEGMVLAMDDLLRSIKPAPFRTSKQAQKVEETFESIRLAYYPHKPSRLRCYFLSLSEDSAKKRQKECGWSNRKIVKCRLILSSGRFHYANIREYEEPAKNEYIGSKDIEAHAHRYWNKCSESNLEVNNIEVLADCALYFPDWSTFSLLQVDSSDLEKNPDSFQNIEVFSEDGENPPRWQSLTEKNGDNIY